MQLKKSHIIFTIISILFFISIEVFYYIANSDNTKKPIVLSYIFGYFIFLILFTFITSIFGNLKKSSIFMTILLLLLMVINQLKIVYSSEPLFLTDIFLLNSGDTFFEILNGTIFNVLLGLIPSFTGYLFFIGIIIFISFKTDIKFNNKKKRLLSGILSFIMLILLIFPLNMVQNTLLDTFYKTENKKDNHTTSNIKYYFMHSFFGGLYGEYLLNDLKMPENYSKDSVNSILSSISKDGTTSEKTFKKPNIIMVFSESFFDITKINEVTFDKDVTKNFKRLKKEGLSFNMISPTFGGLSANPEFEILTGSNLSFYPGSYIPYMNLYTREEAKSSPSIINELNVNGYETNILSCWDSSLFNASNVYDQFKVKNIMFKTNLKNIDYKGKRISESYVKNQVINYFNNKKDGVPAFFMTLTAQAHMPYPEDKYTKDEYDINIKSTTLSKEKSGIIRAYAQGIYDADKELNELYEYIKTLKEDTILVFYGDHLPFLKTAKGDDIYNDLSYFNTKDELLNTYRTYNTECLILSNFEMDLSDTGYALGVEDTLNYDLIMPFILNNMDINLNDYYKYLYTTKDTLPAFNNFVALNKSGKLESMSSLSKGTKKLFEERSIINWKFFFDN